VYNLVVASRSSFVQGSEVGVLCWGCGEPGGLLSNCKKLAYIKKFASKMENKKEEQWVQHVNIIDAGNDKSYKEDCIWNTFTTSSWITLWLTSTRTMKIMRKGNNIPKMGKIQKSKKWNSWGDDTAWQSEYALYILYPRFFDKYMGTESSSKNEYQRGRDHLHASWRIEGLWNSVV
jgi:hypothetical protein